MAAGPVAERNQGKSWTIYRQCIVINPTTPQMPQSMSEDWTTKSVNPCSGNYSSRLAQLVSPNVTYLLNYLITLPSFSVNVHMPKDRVTQMHQGYGFVEFLSEEDADYAIKIMNMIKLYGKPIRVNKASAHQKNLDVGANIFIGNLDTEVDEKLLYDTFSAFGVILQTPKIMRDPETGNSKGFAFVNFASFEASDAAMDAMNGQYLCNRPISVSYAFKKDSKGERHGSAAERLLAAQNPLSHADRPHQLFADAPVPPPPPMMIPGQMMQPPNAGFPSTIPPPPLPPHMMHPWQAPGGFPPVPVPLPPAPPMSAPRPPPPPPTFSMGAPRLPPPPAY